MYVYSMYLLAMLTKGLGSKYLTKAMRKFKAQKLAFKYH